MVRWRSLRLCTSHTVFYYVFFIPVPLILAGNESESRGDRLICYDEREFRVFAIVVLTGISHDNHPVSFHPSWHSWQFSFLAERRKIFAEAYLRVLPIHLPRRHSNSPSAAWSRIFILAVLVREEALFFDRNARYYLKLRQKLSASTSFCGHHGWTTPRQLRDPESDHTKRAHTVG